YEMLEPGGAFVHLGTGDWGERASEDDDLPHPPPPEDQIRKLCQQYLGTERRAGQGVLRHGTPGGEAEVLQAAGFDAPVVVPVPGGGQVVERDIDDVVAGVFANSSSAPHLFGDRLGQFERELRALLSGSTSTGR